MTTTPQTSAPVSLEALEKLERIAAFLDGAAPLDRHWFDDRDAPSPYWWRKPLREAVEALATLRLAQSGAVGAWVSVNDRLPEDGTECLVVAKYGNDPKFYRVIDTWRMQREAPVSFSSATIETGLMWDDHDFDDVLFWQPLPAPPALTPPSAKGE